MSTDNLKQQAYNTIKSKILSCEYAPGAYLSESILISHLGMSRTPIRDALSRLEQEGLVDIHSKRGIWVKSFTFKDINDLFELRRLMEVWAMKNHAYKIERAVLQDMYNELQALDISDSNKVYEVDDRLHELIIQSTNNEYIIQAYLSTRNQIYRLRRLTAIAHSSSNRMYTARIEHLHMLQAMLDGDYNTATQALTDHLNNSCNSSFTMLTRNVEINIAPFTNITKE